MTKSIFLDYRDEIYSERFAAEIVVDKLIGGVPQDPQKVEGWLRSKVETSEEILQELLMDTLLEIGGDPNNPEDREKAAVKAAKKRNLNGFKRIPGSGELFIEGRQIKAGIKEATNIRFPWENGKNKIHGKSYRAFVAEHVFVEEDRIPLRVAHDLDNEAVAITDPTDIQLRFVTKTRMGNTGMQLEEYVEDAILRFTVLTDEKFPPDFWGRLWTTAELQGIGAVRSQSFGRFAVTKWDRIP